MAKKKKEKNIVKIDQKEEAVIETSNVYLYDLSEHKKIPYAVDKAMLIIQNKNAEIGICFDNSCNKIELNLYNKKGDSKKSLFSFEQVSHLIKSSELVVD